MADTAGGIFDKEKKDELRERILYAPRIPIISGMALGMAVRATAIDLYPTRWNLRRVRDTFDWLKNYSLSGIWRLLRRLGIKLRNGRPQQFSPDPEYKEKEKRLYEVLEEVGADPGNKVALFLDELTYYRWPLCASEWGEEAHIPLKARPGNTKWRIIGTLDALTGRVLYLQGYVAGVKKYIEFLRKIAREYPNADTVYVILDNWHIHYHEDALKALEDLPQIKLIFLPTYSPWLNPTEKLWGWLKGDVIKMHRLAHDWAGLKRKVARFLDLFSEGSVDLLRRVGLLYEGKLAKAIRKGKEAHGGNMVPAN